LSASTNGRPRHALTVDVEDWYHVENLRPSIPLERWADMEGRLDESLDRLLQLFADTGVSGTFFVLGAAADRHKGIVRRIVDAGHELACHGWSHDLVYRQTRDVFEQETRRAKAMLEDMGGVEVIGYRASTFSVCAESEWALEVLLDAGFRYDSSIAPFPYRGRGMPGTSTTPYRIPVAGGREIVEFPVSALSVFGRPYPIGGGFFRFFPGAWTSRGLDAIKQGGMFYIHPWEIDPGQPRVHGLGLKSRLRHYWALDRTHDKLAALFRRHEWDTMANMLQEF